MHVPPQLTAAQGAGETGPQPLRSPDTPRAVGPEKAGGPGTLQPPIPPMDAPQEKPGRGHTARGCVWATAPKELRRASRGKVRTPCETTPLAPLGPPGCTPLPPATAPLRPPPALAAQSAFGGLLSGREGGPPMVATPRERMLGVREQRPPPR
ncbi:hypothetical protein GWK47_026248 [Chionoecetes opilio]|uniref:Uncharacterized protein n=1 Tax=Chionoecetes opilio TaxID=41210 RepID=A0A8J8WAJ0_CHIOP|nr:hypothetical protein GWK47_026248 [Chionoecetes opilio]